MIHVLVPHEVRRSSRAFVRVQRTHRLDPQTRAGNGYTVCSVARAVADACRGLATVRDVRVVVAESVQTGLTSVDALERELSLAGTSRTALLRRAIRGVSSGARSAPEIELQETLAGSRLLPAIIWNPWCASAEEGAPAQSRDVSGAPSSGQGQT